MHVLLDVLRGWARGKGCSHEIWVWLGKISSGIPLLANVGQLLEKGGGFVFGWIESSWESWYLSQDCPNSLKLHI